MLANIILQMYADNTLFNIWDYANFYVCIVCSEVITKKHMAFYRIPEQGVWNLHIKYFSLFEWYKKTSLCS